jgi:hypothetical protein
MRVRFLLRVYVCVSTLTTKHTRTLHPHTGTHAELHVPICSQQQVIRLDIPAHEQIDRKAYSTW